MKRLLVVPFCFLLVCCSQKDSFSPDEQLTLKEKEAFINSIIRYTTKPPRKIGDEERFNPAYDQYYSTQAQLAKLEFYTTRNGYQYFVLSQPAPSITVKRHATGGRSKYGSDGKLEDYEEIFRTWKMTPDTLVKRSRILFEKMVNGEKLEPFYPQNSKGTEYIEFPDERTYYDKQKRKWAVRNE
jgi:hypothetical protein